MTHTYAVCYHFNSRPKVELNVVARTIADALSIAHKQLLGRRKIADSGYEQGKLPRSVTVTRVTHRANKGVSAST